MSSISNYGAPDQDFKYILQDLSKTMIGARFTYSELMEQERVPFKFQTIIDRLILKNGFTADRRPPVTGH